MKEIFLATIGAAGMVAIGTGVYLLLKQEEPENGEKKVKIVENNNRKQSPSTKRKSIEKVALGLESAKLHISTTTNPTTSTTSQSSDPEESEIVMDQRKIWDFVLNSLDKDSTFDKILMPRSSITSEVTKMHQLGLTSLLTNVLRSSDDPKILRKTGFVLSNMSLNPLCHRTMISDQTITVLLQRASQCPSFREDACQILLNIANSIDEESIRDVRDEVPFRHALLRCLTPSYSPETDLCLGILNNLRMSKSFGMRWSDIIRSNPNFIATLSQLSRLSSKPQVSSKATMLLISMDPQNTQLQHLQQQLQQQQHRKE